MPKPTKAKLNKYRASLLHSMQQLGAKMEHMEESVLRAEPDGGGDQGDEMNSEGNREFQLGLIENEDVMLADVRDALDRMLRGVYGKCGNCAVWVPERRLMVVPYARYCVECQTKSEAGELSQD